jgi:hypothetical protein
MKEVYYHVFLAKLCQDFDMITTKELVLKLPADNKKVKSFTTSRARDVRIFDGQIEHPYMLNEYKRNDEILSKGKELRYKTSKSLRELISEYNLPIQTKPCRICEGNGWTSSGTRYSYENMFIEI